MSKNSYQFCLQVVSRNYQSEHTVKSLLTIDVPDANILFVDYTQILQTIISFVEVCLQATKHNRSYKIVRPTNKKLLRIAL